MRPTFTTALMAAVLLAQPLQAQGADPCATVNAFGMRRWPGQFKAEIDKCEAAQPAVGSRDVSKAISGPAVTTKATAPPPMAAYSGGDDASEPTPRAIYVRDDRFEAEMLDKKVSHRKISALKKAVRATGAMVYADRIQASGNGYRLQLKSYFDEYKVRLCEKEAFANSKVGAFCTVFLVGPRLVATAGHCFNKRLGPDSQPLPNTFKVVFGFETRNGVERENFEGDEVYEGVRLVERFWENPSRGDILRDFALLELDRDVPAKIAEPLRLAGPARMTVEADTPLGVIGHPDGLAKKISFASDITKTGVSRAMEAGAGNIFRAQLNTFKGNSGSPVIFYDEPDVVAGILVEGENDYISITDPAGGVCKQTAIVTTNDENKRCPYPGGKELCSEKVTKSTLIEPYVAE